MPSSRGWSRPDRHKRLPSTLPSQAVSIAPAEQGTAWSAYSRFYDTPSSAAACQLTPRDRL